MKRVQAPLLATLFLVMSACGKDKNKSDAAPVAPAVGEDGRTTDPREFWNPGNNPSLMGSDFDKGFFALPLSGKLDETPWTDTYWPSNRGGISARWADAAFNSDESNFGYVPPSREQVARMTKRQLALLSPAEKFDIYNGDYSYPTVQSERRRVRPTLPSWEGLCHGWAPAAVHFKEPQPVTMRNADGVEIPFGSSDVKALLTYYQGNVASNQVRTVGIAARCYESFATNPAAKVSLECRDTNAGAFHVVMANMLGKKKKGFIIDETQDAEVWNQPAYEYSSRIEGVKGPSANAAPGTVTEVVVVTRLTYTKEVRPSWEPLNGTGGFYFETKTYRYRLELDSTHQILGGEWLNENLQPSASTDRPDFLWMADKPTFNGNFSSLETIYKAASGQ